MAISVLRSRLVNHYRLRTSCTYSQREGSVSFLGASGLTFGTFERKSRRQSLPAMQQLSVRTDHTTAWPSSLRNRRTYIGHVSRKAPGPYRGAARQLRVAQVEQQASVGKPSEQAIPLSPSQAQARKTQLAGELPRTLCDIWVRNAELYGDLLALRDPHHQGSPELTFRQLYDTMQDFAAGLAELGLRQYDKVALFSENSNRWMISDGAVMSCGAAVAVRGATAPSEELLYICGHSEATGMLVQDGASLGRITKAAAEHEQKQEGNPLAALRFVVVLWGETTPAQTEGLPCPVLSYSSVLESGAAVRRSGGFTPADVAPGDLASLVYTSGTTGHPKGVMLMHSNLAYQAGGLQYFFPVQPGDRVLSMLPPWHIYERAVAYHYLYRGAHLVYTNIRKVHHDIATFQPDHFSTVPLILDSLYSRVRHKLASGPQHEVAITSALLSAGVAYVRARRIVKGISLQHALPAGNDEEGAEAAAGAGKGSAAGGGVVSLLRRFSQVVGAAVLMALLAPLHALAGVLVYGKVRAALGVRKTFTSGGGSLAAHLDDFFEAVGLTLCNVWGLTETSPMLACRRAQPPEHNVRGTVGLPNPGTEIRVVDPETLQPLPAGRKGLVMARGPGVMKGYYRNEEATQKAFRAGDGWFDTGDLGFIVPSGVPFSRCDGMIVLSGRAKDTIVLSSGKNVEPQPIEDAVVASRLVKHMVLLGQDKRELGALVWADYEAVEQILGGSGGADGSGAPAEGAEGRVAISDEQLESRLMEEVTRLNSARTDYEHYHHIAHIAVVREPLSFEAGTLTRSMKLRRPEIMKVHAKDVAQLMGRLRG
ncbi:hypothetical protein Agub_g14636 [Astrephomene gubernaculifera]|uniref:AMP-dependent synthetase/ligase domain-containing protein n=1 Tax=Astrephomene gubernaculifera TaxID=47775 RepID=A0AAD3E402_9CHLO|nr:hypothetical protein Agub_g14636 [Astrephomene gubernaculifera]